MTRQRIANRRKAREQEARALVVPDGQVIALRARRGFCRAHRGPAIVGAQGICLSCLAKAKRQRLLPSIEWDPQR